jgi:hypothetical protein
MKTKLSKRPNLKGRSIYISLVLCATVVIVTAVYGFGVATFFQGAAKTSLAENSKYLDWRALNVKHYSFLLDSSCSNHNAKNLRIEVRDGKTVWPRDENYPSMDELFQLIDSAKQKADQVTVYYHDLGFPRYASINWNEQYFDFGCGFTIEQFRVLNGIGPIPTLIQEHGSESLVLCCPNTLFLLKIVALWVL